jgi:glyoxylase-like metal-dependent hydrolase (beta-lactamase superfamily II)
MVYALETSAGMVIVNAGTGEWLEAAKELPGRLHCVVLTHFFRDHSAGAVKAAGAGIPVWAPYWEQEQLADARAHFQRRETYIIYDNTWDLFAPLENIPVERWLLDWEIIQAGDAEFTVVPTPGVTLGALSLVVRRSGKTGVFCGEVLHSPGKIGRVAPLQYNYNDLDGAPNLLYSIGQLRSFAPDWIAGSTAPAVVTGAGATDDALSALAINLDAALRSRGGYEQLIAAATHDELEEISPHLYRSRHAVASTYFLASDSGKVMAIDYGYRAIGEDYASGLGIGGAYSFPRHRRPLIHGVAPLRELNGAESIDSVLLTHFHDDHVNGIPMLQRLYGTKCYAAETFAHILQDPLRFAFPCTWPEPIDVTPLPVQEPFRWEEYEFTFKPISGHTRFATLIAFEVDGERIVATGDQFFFQDFDNPGTGPAAHNHVYRNGAVLTSIRESVEFMRELAPTVILPGHGPAYKVPPDFNTWIAAYAEDYERIHSSLMPLGADEAHFDVDSRAAWLEPYRTRAEPDTTLEFQAHVRNPYPTEATLQLSLSVPEGWGASTASLRLAARAEGTARLTVHVPAATSCRRQPIGLELSGPDRVFGQVTLALVTVGSERF